MELQKPYYAVIFTNLRTEGDNGYGQMAEVMETLARKQPGFLGFESARDGLGIAVSYWESLEAIANWKSQMDHKQARKKGIQTWYSWYKVRICKVEREYEFNK
ncbi:antibiotic biosynthesis monooxygenase family protein [Flagellimonas zhangzhouensis]|uniref:Heme-degrading monooxygenase HmoA n=1 Tax=Flagellimonas zhangzhouensis TaxID=1073328 RepID=A0A1H2V4K1_9FLAO|nr:antibiotic biosynthesis monooxygenase [Allomuricauda zhangzhouensis]SDQ10939.1 Heme-degrading monooxygenase HmoA [Allomuricauda zhangzhouensis]SDW63217.1 Heme-degrading monooxygenase HmoA [Allomuricauda zhangzhouensis]